MGERDSNQIQFNILVKFLDVPVEFAITFSELEQCLAACHLSVKVNPQQGSPFEGPSSCLVQKVCWTLTGCLPRWILNGVDLYTFQHTHLEPPLKSYAWQLVSVRSVSSSSEPHCCFSLSHSMTPCWFFHPYYSLRKGIVLHLLW